MMVREQRRASDLRPGYEFGHKEDTFTLGEHLGKGGQGMVHVCVRKSTSHKYAVKIVDARGLKMSKRNMECLRFEIRNMNELHHPRIVNLHHSWWDDDGRCFMVLDLATGGDLHSRIESEVRSTRVPPFKGLGGCEEASRHVTLQLLDGIAYMHAKHVIHRDLKLENVLIHKTEKGPVCDLHDVKIGDLGLSKYVGPASSSGNQDTLPGGNQDISTPTVPVVGAPKMTKRLSVVGSPDFVAPEVLEQAYDERADLWSLGVMVYAMFCGMWPFDIKAHDCLKPAIHKAIVTNMRAPESWLQTSNQGRSFVEGLLTVNPDDRLSIDGCRAHAWLHDDTRSSESWSLTRELPDHGDHGNGGAGAVKSISGRTGDAVDFLELKFRQGRPEKYGGDGGNKKTAYELRDDEIIIGVMQETRGDEYLGNNLCFYTSQSRICDFSGWSARRTHRFVAPQGRQIVGLQFDSAMLVGIHSEKLTGSCCGAVEKISGRVGHAVDQVTMKLRDGEVLDYGTGGGEKRGPFHLEPDEYITIVEQDKRDAFLGNSIVFYTSAGKVIKLLGMQSANGIRVSVPAGSQLCGLEFKGAALDKVYVCAASGGDSSRRAVQVSSA